MAVFRRGGKLGTRSPEAAPVGELVPEPVTELVAEPAACLAAAGLAGREAASAS